MEKEKRYLISFKVPGNAAVSSSNIAASALAGFKPKGVEAPSVEQCAGEWCRRGRVALVEVREVP